MPQAAPCPRRSSRFLALLAGGLLVLALLPTPGRAQTTVQVTTLADSGPGSLRAVLAAAPSGATVLFAPGLSGTIPLTSPLVIDRSLTVQGPGAAIIALSGQDSTRVLDAGNGGAACGITVGVSGLTVRNGAAPDKAAGIWTCITLTLDAVTLRDNVVRAPLGALGTATSLPMGGPPALGGGVFNEVAGALTVRNSTFSGNQALGGAGGSGLDAHGCGGCGGAGGGGGLGGAIYTAGALGVSDSTFADNAASGGAGGSGGPAAGGGAGGVGSAIFVDRDCGQCATKSFTVTTSTFDHNQAVNGPPGLVLGGTGGPSGNGANGGPNEGGGGSGLGGAGGFGGSPAGGGGAVDTSPVGNGTRFGGLGGTGAASAAPGQGGGAVTVSGNGNMTISASAFTNNTAPLNGSGAGILIVGGVNGAIENSTFVGQSASTGSAIFAAGSGNVELRYSTVSGNSASPDQGAVWVFTVAGNAPVFFRASVLANNTGGSCGGSAGIGAAGDNLSDDGNCSPYFRAGQNDRVVTGTPLVGTFGNHGGPTQTFDLPPGSPALDGVSYNGCPPPGTDQRGYLRPAGARCDVGAFEAGAVAPSPTPTVTNTPTATATATSTAAPTSTNTATPTSTATATPTSTATVTATWTATPIAAAGGTPTSAATPRPATATPTPAGTPTPFPRPDVGVQVAPAVSPTGTHRLRVTLTPRDAGCAQGNNQLRALHFTRTDNAAVDVGSVVGGSGDFTVPAVQSGPLTFVVNRVAAGLATTVQLIVSDGCGDWPTFVGGGASAF